MKYDRFLRSVTECTRAKEAAHVPAQVSDVRASSLAGEMMLASVARPTAKRSRREKMYLEKQVVFWRDDVEHGWIE